MKRFTETTKWNDPWFQDLPSEYKLLWGYLCDTCDSAGVWKLNMRLAKFQIGVEVTEEKAKELFGKRIHVLDEEKWFIVAFIKFQYGELSEDCRPHKPVIQAIKNHNLERVLKGYQNPTNRVQDKDKDKEKEKEQDKTPKGKASDISEVIEFISELSLPKSDAEWFFHKCQGNGWSNGGKPIKDWRATMRSWNAGKYFPSQKQFGPPSKPATERPMLGRPLND